MLPSQNRQSLTFTACGAIAFALLATTASAQRILNSFQLPTNETVLGLRSAPDVDNDGVDDFITVSRDRSASPNDLYRVYVVSGANGTLVHQLGTASPNGSEAFGFGDANNDGHGDVLVNFFGINGYRVYSGATGTLLYTQPQGYTSMCAVGDFDGNGRADYAGARPSTVANGMALFSVLRGENGAGLGGGTQAVGSSIQGLHPVGDLSGDGRTDLALFLSDDPALILRTDTGAVVRTTGPSTASELSRRSTTIDLDGDGLHELLFLRGQGVSRIDVYDDSSSSFRYSVATPLGFTSGLGNSAAGVGDLNSDGFSDFVAGNEQTPSGELFAFSGRNGARIWTFEGDPLSRIGKHLTALGDADNDGHDDFACSYQGDGLGGNGGAGVHVISGKVLAEVTAMHGACGNGPFLPQLGMSRPILGQPTQIVGRDGPSNTNGILAFSLQPTQPVYLGVSTCFALYDLGAGAPLLAVTQGNWSVTLPLPLVPQFAGLPLALQCIYGPTSGPMGLDLSNGVWAVAGYL